MDRFVWYFQRATGLAMVALVFVHLGIMHVLRAPSSTTAVFVSARWAAEGWRTFDGALLVLALTHGLLGAHAMLRGTGRGRRRALLLDALFSLAGVLTVAGGLAVVVATPVPLPARGILSPAAWIGRLFETLLLGAATAAYVGIIALASAIAWRIANRRSLGWWCLPGQWAFALNRVAGLGILAFLLLHVADVAILPLAPDIYTRLVAAYGMPYLLPMELLLVGAVLYHGLNGLRLMLLETLALSAQGALTSSFLAVLALAALLTIPSIVTMVR